MEGRPPGKEIKLQGEVCSPVQLVSDPMLPFLRLLVVVTNDEGKSKEVPARIQPSEIDYYYPGFYEGTVIVTKSRSSYLTLMNTEEFDQTLKAYHDAIASNAGVFGVLTITPKSKLHAAD